MHNNGAAGNCAYPSEAALPMVRNPYAYFTKDKPPDY